MSIILNKEELVTNELRRDALDILEKGLQAIDTEKVLNRKIFVENDTLNIDGYLLDLKSYEKIFFVGIGKCALDSAKVIGSILGDYLTEGIVIDVKTSAEAESLVSCGKIRYFVGTHPYPSEQNIEATKEVLKMIENLSRRDLVITLISGGGSSLFDLPTVDISTLVEITKSLTEKAADIFELNAVRKHLSKVKGGGFAKICFPAQVISLIFSDVPSNDMSTIASGPTVLDRTDVETAKKVLEKYSIKMDLEFVETPKDAMYFEKVRNIMLVSNTDSLEIMGDRAEELGYNVTIETDRFSGDAKQSGEDLAKREPKPKTCILFGGETTTVISNNQGKGGRNQTMALAALPFIKPDSVLVCASSDGWDNTEHAGALADSELFEKAKNLNLVPEEFLEKSDSYNFFKQAGGAICTGRLGSNVSDLFIMLYK
ncbi:MAG: DUF4147 domain-containing protein [Parcubacteria group bacterium]|jgi:glycerate-2-kinase|nr:DUF4147 domain-containing protein [Parcubacteria group bacterium]